MADYSTERSIGARIAAARRSRGYRSTRELAAAMEGTGLTEAVLENMELGRRSNIDVTHVLNLAHTLGVPVVSLLAPIARPSAVVDLPNLKPALAQMTAAEFDAWLCAIPGSDYVATSVDERSDRAELEALRELQVTRRELRRLAIVEQLESGAPPSRIRREDDVAHAEALRQRVQRLRDFLASAGWDV